MPILPRSIAAGDLDRYIPFKEYLAFSFHINYVVMQNNTLEAMYE